jgi:hypothetical protein
MVKIGNILKNNGKKINFFTIIFHHYSLFSDLHSNGCVVVPK